MAAASPAVLEQISKFDRQSKAQFMANYEVRQQTAIMAKLNQILEVIPSDGPEEKFPFFGAVGQIQEFDGASLPMMALGATEHTIENKKWGLGMAVKKDFFNDIGRMPGARERLRNRIANGLAARAVNYLSLLISKLLKGEAPFNNLVSHDGESLFSADHAGGTNIHSGTMDDYSMPTLETEHRNLLDKMSAQTDPDSHDNMREEAPNRLLYLVEPLYLPAYAAFFRATHVPTAAVENSGADAIAQSNIANIYAPNPNLAQGIDGLGNQVILCGWSRIRGTKKAFVFDLTEDLAVEKPLVWLDREKFHLEFNGPTEDNPKWFFEELMTWKVVGRGGLGISGHERAFLLDKSA